MTDADTMAAGLALRSHDAFYVAERPGFLLRAQGIAKRWPSDITRAAVDSIQRDVFNDMIPRRVS